MITISTIPAAIIMLIAAAALAVGAAAGRARRMDAERTAARLDAAELAAAGLEQRIARLETRAQSTSKRICEIRDLGKAAQVSATLASGAAADVRADLSARLDAAETRLGWIDRELAPEGRDKGGAPIVTFGRAASPAPGHAPRVPVAPVIPRLAPAPKPAPKAAPAPAPKAAAKTAAPLPLI